MASITARTCCSTWRLSFPENGEASYEIGEETSSSAVKDWSRMDSWSSEGPYELVDLRSGAFESEEVEDPSLVNLE